MFFNKKRKFDPAVYYGEIPKDFNGKVEFVQAFSVRIEDCAYKELWDKSKEKEDIVKMYEKRGLSKLEKNVLSSLKNSDGDLAILNKPEFQVASYAEEERKFLKEVTLVYSYSVNGSLYKIKKELM